MFTDRLAAYIVGVAERDLPAQVTERARVHILDSIAAMVSGSRLPAGLAGARFVAQAASTGGATVIGTGLTGRADDVALANAMAGHADETDDSHAPSLTHPGCGVVAAALALAERDDRSGQDLLRAVTLGYDVAGRINPALWPDYTTLRTHSFATHSFGNVWGSAAAGASLARLSVDETRQALSYAAQQTAGIKTWVRDKDHIEKAFAFAGMAASNAVRAVVFIEADWTGVVDVLDDQPNFLDIYGSSPDGEILVGDLGERFIITETNIKQFSVGSPIQSPLQGLLEILREENVAAADVSRIKVTIPSGMMNVVRNPDMPDISLPYLLTVALEDREVSFAACHDVGRFEAWQKTADPDLLELVGDPDMPHLRQAHVEVTTTTGVHRRHVLAARGTAADPMSSSEVAAKAGELCAPVLGADRSRQLVAKLLEVDDLASVRELRPLLRED